MKEDHEIDRLFDPAFNDKDLIKSAKRKSYFRMTGVSFLVSVCVLALLILLKIQLTPYVMHQKMVAKELYYDIYGANTYVGVWDEQYKLIGSSAEAPKYKLLNGKPVHLGDVSLDSSDRVTTIGNSKFAQFSYNGNRVMNFFHPSLPYDEYANDLQKLNEVNEGKIIEMALSFDQAYTYDEIVSMLPKNVTLQWNWVNAYSSEELEGFEASDSLYAEYPTTILKEYEVAGFPSISEAGEIIENPVDDFLETLDLAQTKGGSYKEEFTHIYETLQKDTNENVEIIGAVVVGDKQQLSTLIDKPYIKASSFGVIIDQY